VCHRGAAAVWIKEVTVARKGGGTTGRSGRAKAGSAAGGSLERLHDSIDAAHAALTDVRSEMSRGSRELLKDVETTLRDARKNLRRVSGRVSKDLEEVQQAIKGQGQTKQRKPAQRKAGGRARSAGATKRSASKK
jgi:ABC-type transporter Mla subunit MlaD